MMYHIVYNNSQIYTLYHTHNKISWIYMYTLFFIHSFIHSYQTNFTVLYLERLRGLAKKSSSRRIGIIIGAGLVE